MSRTTAAVDEAGEDGEDNETTDAAADADHDGFVAVDPGADLAAYRGALAAAVGAVAAATAGGAVEEVLLETGAGVRV